MGDDEKERPHVPLSPRREGSSWLPPPGEDGGVERDINSHRFTKEEAWEAFNNGLQEGFSHLMEENPKLRGEIVFLTENRNEAGLRDRFGQMVNPAQITYDDITRLRALGREYIENGRAFNIRAAKRIEKITGLRLDYVGEERDEPGREERVDEGQRITRQGRLENYLGRVKEGFRTGMSDEEPRNRYERTMALGGRKLGEVKREINARQKYGVGEREMKEVEEVILQGISMGLQTLERGNPDLEEQVRGLREYIDNGAIREAIVAGARGLKSVGRSPEKRAEFLEQLAKEAAVYGVVKGGLFNEEGRRRLSHYVEPSAEGPKLQEEDEQGLGGRKRMEEEGTQRERENPNNPRVHFNQSVNEGLKALLEKRPSLGGMVPYLAQHIDVQKLEEIYEEAWGKKFWFGGESRHGKAVQRATERIYELIASGEAFDDAGRVVVTGGRLEQSVGESGSQGQPRMVRADRENRYDALIRATVGLQELHQGMGYGQGEIGDIQGAQEKLKKTVAARAQLDLMYASGALREEKYRAEARVLDGEAEKAVGGLVSKARKYATGKEEIDEPLYLPGRAVASAIIGLIGTIMLISSGTNITGNVIGVSSAKGNLIGLGLAALLILISAIWTGIINRKNRKNDKDKI